MYFYDLNWQLIGTKNGYLAEDDWRVKSVRAVSGLLAELSHKIHVPEEVLSHPAGALTCSVAQRMSWAAGRKTRRIEDKAYCLLGIVGVNMPSIYGEGMKAFPASPTSHHAAE